MKKVISFDLKAEFGLLKKPFSNEKLDLYLTFNMLHKPALLGILGAILGLKGFKKNGELPEYYVKLNDSLKVGIEPLKDYHDKGNFQKINIKYNNGVGYASREEGGNLIVHEQTLIKPAFRCYLMLNDDNGLHQNLYSKIKNVEAEYLPYFGKNDFSIWWEKESVMEYTYNQDFDEIDRINSIFFHTNFKTEKGDSIFDIFNIKDDFAYFERLPVEYEKVENSYQYKLYKFDRAEKFVFSSFPIKKNTTIEHIYKLINQDDEVKYIQFY